MIRIPTTPVGRLLAVFPFVVLCHAAVPELGHSQTLQPSTTSINFGGVPVLSGPTSQVLIVTNVGSLVGQVVSANFIGSTAFTHTAQLPVSVAPGETVFFSILFDPVAAGLQTATLTMATNDPVTPTLNVSVSGTGTVACGTITPTANGGGSITRGAVALLTGIGPTGSNCSWSPTIGLTDPLSCSTFAAPTQTTEYQLTVTQNGCSGQASTTVEVVDAETLVGPPGPTGPQGLQGPPGAQGAEGAKGDPGVGLVAGAYLFLAVGSAAPTGFTFIGTTTFSLMPPSGKRQNITVNVYRKD